MTRLPNISTYLSQQIIIVPQLMITILMLSFHFLPLWQIMGKNRQMMDFKWTIHQVLENKCKCYHNFKQWYFMLIDLVVTSCKSAIENMFNSNQHLLIQLCQNNKLPKFMIQIQLHLSFIFQMWSICVVWCPYCKHFTWVKHVKGYTSGKKIS